MSGRSLVGLALDAVRNRAPVAYAPRSGGLPFGANSSRTGLLAQYGSVGTLFAIVSSSASAVSLVDWELYSTRLRRSATAGKNDRVPVESHLAKDVLNRPNDFMTRQNLFETTEQHIDLVGEGYWVMVTDERMPGVPLELWPVRPDRIDPIPHPTEFLAGWMYRGPAGERVPLRRDEVIQFKMPNPLDPYRGMGPVQTILFDLDSSRYASEYNRAFFLNSAEPGGIIEVPDALSDDEFNTMRDRWQEQHRGVSQAHRVAILEKGQWKDRSFSMRDMQFQQLREVSRETIRDAFHFPKPMTGSVEDINRANAEAGEYVYAKWYLQPRLERFKAKLNTEFLPKFGVTAKQLGFGYELIIPPDKEAMNAERASKTDAFKTLIDAQVEPGDAAEVVGLPPMRMREAPAPEPEGVPA